MSEKRRNRQDFKAWAIACITPLGTGLAVALCFSLLTFTEYLSVVERAVITVVGISSTLILCWWLLALVVILVLAVYQKLSGKAMSIPRWMPKLLKNLAIGSIGLSIYVTPTVSSFAPATAVEQTATQHLNDFVVNDSSLSPAQKESMSSFFTASTHADSEKTFTSFFPEQKTSIQEVDLKTYTDRSHASINPFFPTQPRQPIEERSPDSKGLHTVVSGESLWTIAEQYLPPDSADSQIMEFAHEIYQLNAFQLDSIDTLIHPGQQLLIPSA